MPAARRITVAAATAAVVVASCSRSSETVADPTPPTTDPYPAAAVYQVVVDVCDSETDAIATAVAIRPDRLVTVAHTFDDACSITVAGDDGEPVDATVVDLDTARDIAFLEPAVDAAAVLHLGRAVEGAEALVLTAATGDVETKPVTVVQQIDLRLDGGPAREALELRAELEPGDSGAPVVGRGGAMVGMVFATDRDEPLGWGVAASEIETLLPVGDDVIPDPGAGSPPDVDDG